MPEGMLDHLSQAASLYRNRTSLYRHLGIPPASCGTVGVRICRSRDECWEWNKNGGWSESYEDGDSTKG